MEATASKHSPRKPPQRRSPASSQRARRIPVLLMTSAPSWRPTVVRVMASLRFLQAVRLAAGGCMVGAGGTARKPLAALGLGLMAALEVRSAPAVGAGLRLD